MVLILPIMFAITPTDGSCYRVIDSSILQGFFSSALKFLSCYEEKTVENEQKKKRMNIVVWSCISKIMLVIFATLQFPYVILCPSLMKVQTSKGKVPHIYKDLISRIMAFEYEKLLLLKSMENKVASNIVITKQNKSS